jgi:C1A family cysteine protease
MRSLGTNLILSPEQIVQCDTYSFGCDGGMPEWAFEYVTKAGGLETEADYPYTSGENGVTGTCHSDKSKFKVTVTSFTQIRGESNMAAYVQSTGPLSVVVDANTWGSYTGGILKRCGSSINHAVQAVGVDTGAGYWKIRNSWGADWGENGFIRIAYGQNACDITYQSLYTAVANV